MGKMQDAQNRLVWKRSAVGKHWYQECKWTWSNTKDEIYNGKTWELRQNICARGLIEYKDSLCNKSSLWLYYIEDWTRIDQFEIFEEQEKMLFWMETVFKENHIKIEKVRATSSQFSYTVVTISTWSS